MNSRNVFDGVIHKKTFFIIFDLITNDFIRDKIFKFIEMATVSWKRKCTKYVATVCGPSDINMNVFSLFSNFSHVRLFYFSFVEKCFRMIIYLLSYRPDLILNSYKLREIVQNAIFV